MANTKTTNNGVARKRSSFGKTFYYVDQNARKSLENLDKGPQQMRDMVKFMIDNGITSAAKAKQGAEIGTDAVASGAVKTSKLTGPVIFAYYARRMESDQGLRLAKCVHAKSGQDMSKN